MSGAQLLVLGITITAAALIVLLTAINAIKAVHAPAEQPVKIIQCKDLHHTVVQETDLEAALEDIWPAKPNDDRTQQLPIVGGHSSHERRVPRERGAFDQ
jgi:hypothetical protein